VSAVAPTIGPPPVALRRARVRTHAQRLVLCGYVLGAVALTWRRPPWGQLATAAAVLAVLLLIPLPYQAAPAAPVPGGWQAAFARLRLAPEARVLIVPIPYDKFTQAMYWQASTGAPGALIGGFFLGPNQDGTTKVNPGPATADALDLDPLWAGHRPEADRSLAQIRADLASWHPAAVVEVLRRRSRVPPILTRLLGRPSFRSGRVLVWRR
jgi:hypothetical protein